MTHRNAFRFLRTSVISHGYNRILLLKIFVVLEIFIALTHCWQRWLRWWCQNIRMPRYRRCCHLLLLMIDKVAVKNLCSFSNSISCASMSFQFFFLFFLSHRHFYFTQFFPPPGVRRIMLKEVSLFIRFYPLISSP